MHLAVPPRQLPRHVVWATSCFTVSLNVQPRTSVCILALPRITSQLARDTTSHYLALAIALPRHVANIISPLPLRRGMTSDTRAPSRENVALAHMAYFITFFVQSNIATVKTNRPTRGVVEDCRDVSTCLPAREGAQIKKAQCIPYQGTVPQKACRAAMHRPRRKGVLGRKRRAALERCVGQKRLKSVLRRSRRVSKFLVLPDPQYYWFLLTSPTACHMSLPSFAVTTHNICTFVDPTTALEISMKRSSASFGMKANFLRTVTELGCVPVVNLLCW